VIKTYDKEDLKQNEIPKDDTETLFIHFSKPQYVNVKDFTKDNIVEVVDMIGIDPIQNAIYHTTVTKQFNQQKKLIELLDHYYETTKEEGKTYARFKEFFLPVFNEYGYTKSMQNDDKVMQEIRHAPAFLDQLLKFINYTNGITDEQMRTVLTVEMYSAGYSAGTKTAMAYYIIDGQLIIPMIAFSGICLTFPITQNIKDLLIKETKGMNPDVFKELQGLNFG
jgi:hypothetical protein